MPVGAGPGGHTQRLLTVVKSGSIQDVKAQPIDKVHTWPHLLAAEFVASLACTLFTFLFSIWVNAPLLQHSNPNQTPNPSKAPWYFLGLQELLTMFHPMIAGVTIPGVGLIVLIFAPYIDKNPSNKPEDRKFADLADDRAHHVLGGARDDRLVLPRSRLQLHPAVARRLVLRAVSRGEGDAIMSTTAAIVIAVAVVVVLGALAFVTFARRSDVRGAGALSNETLRRDAAARAASRRRSQRPARTAADAEAEGVVARTGVALAPIETDTGLTPWMPPDPEAIGVSRRQFFNRATISLMAAGIGTFSAAASWSPSCGRPRPAASAARCRSARYDDIIAGIRTGQRLLLRARGARLDHRLPGRRAPQGRGDLSTSRCSSACARASIAQYQKCPHLGCRVPQCVVEPVVRVRLPRLAVQPGRREEGWPGTARHGPLPARVLGRRRRHRRHRPDRAGMPIGTNTTGQEAEGPHCVRSTDR